MKTMPPQFAAAGADTKAMPMKPMGKKSMGKKMARKGGRNKSR